MSKIEQPVWDKLNVLDWPISRALALRGDRSMPLLAANTVSRLGNWPLYPLIAIAVLMLHRQGAGLILGCATASIVLLHAVYPAMKRLTARPRPMDVENCFPHALSPLDRYSFPSGHVMTLTAALVPILNASPTTWPLALFAWISMAWARLAVGHHYASDIVAGTMLGAAVSAGLVYCIAP